jgi:hypothetical protein
MKRTLGEPLRALRALASGYPLHHLRGCGLRPCHSVVPLLSLSQKMLKNFTNKNIYFKKVSDTRF